MSAGSDEIGKKIEKVNESWNDAIRSYQRFLGPTLNKIEKKIGIEQGKQTNVPKEIDEEIEVEDTLSILESCVSEYKNHDEIFGILKSLYVEALEV